ncbi:MAG: hypothetical protein RI958_398, partial [Actinomycetota bacterium]
MGDGTSRIGYVPGLDGLRALAVVAVLLFHSGYRWASGGFLGVSVFFTLSGYLITTLLLAEFEQAGRISLKGFYARRARRLLPASLLCLGAVVAAWPWWTDSQRRDLPGDVIAVVANVANWRFAFAEASYRELFEQAASPVAHFWSLSIEEQCYLVLPVVVLVGLRRGRRSLGAVLAALAVASLAAMLATDDFDLAYNATHTRAAELLVGAFVAVLRSGRPLPGRSATRLPRVTQLAGGAALVVLALAVGVVDVGDRWLMRGGLAAVAVVSVVLVVAVTEPGPLGRTLGVPWLAAIGRVSYGIYLFHWPIFTLATPERVGFDGVGLLLVRCVVVAVCVVVSYRLLEQPIRQRRLLRQSGAAGLITNGLVVAGSMSVIVGAVVLAPTPTMSSTDQLLAAARTSNGVLSLEAPVSSAARVRSASTSSVPPATTEPVTPSVLVVGSRPVSIGGGVRVVDEVDADCPVSAGEEVQLLDGSVVPIGPCRRASLRWLKALQRTEPDLVVVSLGPLDAGIVRRAGQVGFPTTDQVVEFGARARAADGDLRAALAVVAAGGRPVVLVDHGVADWYRFTMDRAAIEIGDVPIVAPGAPGELDRVIAALLASERDSPEGPPRLLVVGDSTSLFVARALNDAAEGALEVQWAGQEGCAFVRTEATRSSPELDWAPSECRDLRAVLPPVLESFDPDGVLVVAGGMEMVDHRYPGDPVGHAPGSAGYQAFHDLEMQAFLDLLDDPDLPVLVADAPPLG